MTALCIRPHAVLLKEALALVIATGLIHDRRLREWQEVADSLSSAIERIIEAKDNAERAGQLRIDAVLLLAKTQDERQPDERPKYAKTRGEDDGAPW